MNIHLITDTHFSHPKIIEYENRPKDYEKRIFKGLKTIPENEMLIHLGDVSLGNDEAMMRKYIAPLKCKTTLVLGNHDKKSIDWYLQKGFDSVCYRMILKAFGYEILFSHVPRPIEEFNYDLNIHGHCHSNKRLKEFEPTMNDKQLLLAIEKTNYQPVKLKTFIEKKLNINGV